MQPVQAVLSYHDIIPPHMVLDLGRRTIREALSNETVQLPLPEVQVLWSRLYRTACEPCVVDKHFSDACNTICVFLRCSCRNADQRIRQHIFSEKVWFQALDIVHRAFEIGRHKPAIHVLEAMIQLLQENENQALSISVLGKVITEKLSIVYTGQPLPRLKEACIMLSCFIRRASGIVPSATYFQHHDICTETVLQRRCLEMGLRYDDFSKQEALGLFFLALLLTTSVPESRTAALKLLSLLCSKSENIDLSQNVRVASSVIGMYLQSNPEALQDFSINVFPAILLERDLFYRFLNQFHPGEQFSTAQLSIHLAILRTGRQHNFLTDLELHELVNSAVTKVDESFGVDVTKTFGFECILMCSTPMVRLQALNLLTTSNATTAPVPQAALECISKSLCYIHNDTDRLYRDELIGILRRFVNRLEQSHRTLKRLKDGHTESSGGTPDDYTTFLADWSRFLYLELLPNVAYQRHILALQVLSLVLPLCLSLYAETLTPATTEKLTTALLNLLFDAYDDVRSHAASILLMLASQRHTIIKHILENLQLTYLARQLSAQTNRADHADALGRLLMLESFIIQNADCDQSDDAHTQRFSRNHTVDITMSVQDYLQHCPKPNPLSKYPLHGSLLGLVHAIRSMPNTPQQLDMTTTKMLIEVAFRIWTMVKSELCVDSPETEAEDDEYGEDTGPKDLLSYSWRALRDSSLLLQALIETQLPGFQLYSSIGALCLEQLTLLRHRGSLSAVAQTFTLCCQTSRKVDDEACIQLNEAWLEVAFHEIMSQSEKHTRRSAGLPALFAALLDPTDSKQFIAGAKRLIKVAALTPEATTSDVGPNLMKLPQVHALNCLRDIMTNSRFRRITESLVGEMLTLAARCLSNEVWAVRNCGLMLFRACITRLTPGSSDLYDVRANNRMQNDMSTPMTVAVSLLQSAPKAIEDNCITDSGSTDEKGSEITFAALDLIGRIQNHPETRQAIDALVCNQFASKLWAVREHAARLKALRVPYGEELASIRSLLTLDTQVSSNILHGQSLCCRYLFQRHWSQLTGIQRKSTLIQIFEPLSHLEQINTPTRYHPLVLSVLVDLLNDIFGSCLADGLDCTEVSMQSLAIKRQCSQQKRCLQFSLLHRAIALNCAYHMVYDLSQGHQRDATNEQHLLNLMCEQDSMIFVLSNLTDKIAATLPLEVLQVVSFIEPLSSHANTEPAIWRCKSECLSSTKKTAGLVHDQAFVMQSCGTRDLWNEKIGYSGIMLQHALSNEHLEAPSQFGHFVDAVAISLQDELELPTRLQAARAVAKVVSLVCRRVEMFSGELQTGKTRLLFVLYGFLNDDNEDIRQIACAAVGRILREVRNVTQYLHGCTAAARESFLTYMVSICGGTADFVARVCIRIIGGNPLTEVDGPKYLAEFAHNEPVGRTLDELARRAKDLFAEERQNLYIDDIAEVEAWACAMDVRGLRLLETRALEALWSWTSEGVKSLCASLQASSRRDDTDLKTSLGHELDIVHPLGITYNPEILIVFKRVVTMARLLRAYCLSNQNGSPRKVTITHQLQSLQSLAVRYEAHQNILEALDLALEG